MRKPPDGHFVGAGHPSDLVISQMFTFSDGASDEPGARLERHGENLRLTVPGEQGELVLEPDPGQGALAQRLRTAGRRQPLPRALGLHKRWLTVFDGTAGLGRDALVLAKLGATVTAVERVPVLAALLWDLARRAGLGERLQVRCGEALEVLAAADPAPDAVYLDPMFAEPGDAQVKKEMQVCRLLAGPPDDLGPLLLLAREKARDRVVVKRHPRDEPLGGRPSFAVAAARIRFDVYLRG